MAGDNPCECAANEAEVYRHELEETAILLRVIQKRPCLSTAMRSAIRQAHEHIQATLSRFTF